jgi:hypothetical protein
MEAKENESVYALEIYSSQRRERDRAYFIREIERPIGARKAERRVDGVERNRSFLGSYLKIVA